MRPVVRFGLIVILVSLLIAISVSVYFLLNGMGINKTMLILPAVGVLVGIGFMIGGLGSYLGVEGDIENFEHLVGDDIEELARGRITYTHVKTVTTIVAILVEAGLIFKFQKWSATWWGGVPVILITVCCICAVIFGGVTMNWFRDRQRRTHWWVFALFFLGWLLSAWIGAYYAEPIEFVEEPRVAEIDQSIPQTTGTNYSYGYTRASDWDFVGFDGSLFDSISCDDDGCAALLLFVVIVVIVIICVTASATIPHFWVVATCLLLSAMVLVTLRELLVVESSWKSKKDKMNAAN